MADAIGWAFPYIQSVIESVWDVVGPVISKIGSGIEKLAGVVKGIRGGGGDSGGPAPAGGGVAANATGTSFFSGGWTTVGEHGPELMHLPTGSKIMTNSQSVQAGGDKQYHINIEHMEVREESDIEKLAELLARKLEEAEENQ